MGTRRAGRHHRMVRALQSMTDRHLARSQVDQAAGDEEGRDATRPLFGQDQRGLLDPLEATDPGADQNTGGNLIFVAFRVPVGVIERFGCRSHGKDDEVVDLALFLRLHPQIGIEGPVFAVAAWNLAGHLAGQIVGLEGFDATGAALALQNALPSHAGIRPEGRNHSDASDDYTSHSLLNRPPTSGPKTGLRRLCSSR